MNHATQEMYRLAEILERGFKASDSEGQRVRAAIHAIYMHVWDEQGYDTAISRNLSLEGSVVVNIALTKRMVLKMLEALDACGQLMAVGNSLTLKKHVCPAEMVWAYLETVPLD